MSSTIIPAQPGTYVISKDFWLPKILAADGDLEIPAYALEPVIAFQIEADDASGVAPLQWPIVAYEPYQLDYLIVDSRGLVWSLDGCLQNPETRAYIRDLEAKARAFAEGPTDALADMLTASRKGDSNAG